MSQNNYILNLLNIKDENIKITSNSVIYEEFDNIKYKVIEGILTYQPPFCSRCGCVFNEEQTYEKNGFKSSDILFFKSNAIAYLTELDIKQPSLTMLVVAKNFLLQE